MWSCVEAREQGACKEEWNFSFSHFQLHLLCSQLSGLEAQGVGAGDRVEAVGC